MDIQAAVDEYLGAKHNSLTHDTYSWYLHNLSSFLSWCETKELTDLTQISAARVQQFVSDCPSRNTHTRHARAQVVKGFLSWCAEDDEMGVREKAVRRIEMPKIEQSEVIIFTDEEVLSLFKACDRLRWPHRNRAALHLLLETGVRASEMCVDGTRPEEQTGLLLENLIIGRPGTESYIRVIGKGRKIRTIGLGNETRLAVQKYLHRERAHSDIPYLFLAQGNAPWSVKMLQQFLQRLGRHAGIDDVHPHRFRHTFAVKQLMAGTSDLVLMRLMGHTTLESTKIYTRAMSQIQARASATSVVDQIKGGRKRR